MTIEDEIAFFERVPTLSLLGREALRILAIGAESRYIHDGDVLYREGEAADAGYVVQEGSFTLASERAQGAAPVTVGPGAMLEELALLTEIVRPATATATEPSSVIRIPRKLFLKMLEGYPDAARRLREVLALRATQAMADIAGVRPVFDIKAERERRALILDRRGHRVVVGGARPAARFLAHVDGRDAVGQRRSDPDMIEPAALVDGGPIWRPIAPPREQFCRHRHELP